MPDREELKELFDQVDSNNDGKIDLEEFRTFLRSFDTGFGTRDVTEMGFDIVDRDDNEEIDFEEFYAWWTELE